MHEGSNKDAPILWAVRTKRGSEWSADLGPDFEVSLELD
jgi:hypothetical protein